MKKNLTSTRLVLAVISNILQLAIVWIIWRWVLPELNIHLSVTVLVIIMAFWVLIGGVIFVFTTRALKKQIPVGLPSMVGTLGITVAKLAPDGMVKIKGELWSARSTSGSIEQGERIEVTGQEGLKLLVRKTTPSS